jgi:hypothetical protein
VLFFNGKTVSFSFVGEWRKDVKGGRNWSELFIIVGVIFSSEKCDNEGFEVNKKRQQTDSEVEYIIDEFFRLISCRVMCVKCR